MCLQCHKTVLHFKHGATVQFTYKSQDKQKGHSFITYLHIATPGIHTHARTCTHIIWRYSLSCKCHKAPKVFCYFIPFTASFLFLDRQVYFFFPPPSPRPSPIVGIISRLCMQFHTTVSWSVLHSAPIGLVMWNHKSTWKERSVLVPKAMEEAFKEVSSVGIVVKIVQRWKCWKVFGVSARSGCTVLHPHSLKDAHFSEVHGIELLSLDCVLFYVEAMPPHLFHDQSYTEGPASQNASCSLHFSWQISLS